MKTQSISNEPKNIEKQQDTTSSLSPPTKDTQLKREEESQKNTLEILAAPTKSTDFSIYHIGRTLKNLRKEKGYSLKEIEKAIGLSSSYLSMLESGFKNQKEEKNPTLKTIQRYTEFLEIDLFQLMFEVKRTLLEENRERGEKTTKDPSQAKIITASLEKTETLFPTLDLFIQINEEKGAISFDFLLHSESLGYIYESFPGKLIRGYNNIQEFRNRIFQQVKEAGKQTDVVAKLKNLGKRLYDQLFPSIFKLEYRKIRQSQNLSLRVISNETWIPWELVCPFDIENPEEIIDDGFLCIYFQLTRWVSKTPGIPRELQIEQAVLVETGQKENGESMAIKQLLSKNELKNISPDLPTAQQFLDIMESEKVELWHFNLTKEESNPDKDIIVSFQDHSTLNVSDLYGKTQTNMRKNHPFIFFNDYVEKDRLMPSPLTNWAPTFLKHLECCAFIAPSWSVDQNSASEFVEIFYEKIAAGYRIGTAIWKTRQKLYKKTPENPSFLAYSVFANPNTGITFGKAPYMPPIIRKKEWKQPRKKVEFHSGKRLKEFRKIRGLTQVEMIELEGFPIRPNKKLVLENGAFETSSLRRWERNGIPEMHLEKVAQCCHLEIWGFLDDRITEEQFKRMILYPDQQDQVKEDLDKSME